MNSNIRRTPGGAGSGDPHGAPTHDPPAQNTRLMTWIRWGMLIVLGVAAIVTIGSYAASRFGGDGGQAQTAEALYHCPMHPTYTSDKPGECPICGMALEPISSDHAGASAADGNVPGVVGVHLSPERIQMIGVKTATVERAPLGSSMELVAFVTPDEGRLKRVQLRVAGWVRELAVSRTGEEVQAGQPLLTLYSPQLYQSEREFLIELEGAGGADARATEALKAARERLTLLDVPAEEIDRLEREKRAETHLTLRSPVAGTVLDRGVTEGQYVGPNTPLLTMADLSSVWLLVDLYEMDVPRVRVGDRAVFTTDALPGRTFEGRLEFIYPTVSVQTRTVKARITLSNRRGELRPGMYGRVRMFPRSGAVLTIPVDALIDTGEEHYVFIVHEGGHFEPRMVWVGVRDPDRVEITRGLEEGERVVASAAFLIDSESRLKAALAGLGGPSASDHQH